MAARLEGRIAIITGAGSGIGEAIARRFVSDGASVAVADIDYPAAKAVAGSLTPRKRALAISVDISSKDAVQRMTAEVVEKLGAPDILVNNAGVNVFGEPLASTEVDWRRCMAVDLEGAWNCSREALPHFLAKGRGAIVNIASNHSFQVIRDTFPYPIAKHGLIGMTRALALQYADRGVIVNAISPGFVDTPSTRRYFASQPDPKAARADAERRQPIKRLGRPEEIAAIAAFLASDEARVIVGANIVADGGVTIRMYE
ncbi:MAG TPA: SDR family oxidoreductase [Roseiarcus sp.]|nr:SDR family oxidoreductase [Roseiarcus sp.]